MLPFMGPGRKESDTTELLNNSNNKYSKTSHRSRLFSREGDVAERECQEAGILGSS